MSLPSQLGAAGALARFWLRSYAADYIALGILAAGWLLIQLFMLPFHRMFYLDNMALRYPFAEVERVTVLWSVIYSGLTPLITLVLWAAIIRPRTHKAHVTILGLLTTLALSSFLTDIIKNAVGRPRPDLIARCKPDETTSPHVLVTFSVCTQTDQHILEEGWRSFPSGHSSFAFSGLGYLSLFLAGQMHVFRPHADLARCLSCLAPLLGAIMIAISRCEDYRHDVYDVACGSFLGIAVAYFSYRRYYPALRSSNCDIPFEKSDAAVANGFAKLATDEEQPASEDLHNWESSEAPYQLTESPNHGR